MERRELFKILAATGAIAAAPPSDYRPRFFTASEYEAIDRLSETIIPADSESGGAREAGVPRFIDTIVLHSDAASKEFWRTSLSAIERLAGERFGRSVRELESPDVERLVGEILSSETAPQTDLDRFAVRLKALAIEGYSVSQTGFRHFGYKGNRAVSDFPGCTHPEHQA